MLNIDDRLIKEVSPEIGPNALSVLLAIAIHLSQKTGRCFPSHDRLMALTGMGKNSVYEAMRILKEKNLLLVEQSKDTKNNRFGVRQFKVTTRFISIFVTAEDAEPLPETPFTGQPGSGNREPDLRQPENRDAKQINEEEQINEGNKKEKEYTQAEIDEAIKAFFTPNTEEPKSPPVPPPPPPVDTIDYATDIAVRYVQENLANYKNWHDIRFVKMPETPQAMRTDIEDFFVYWQRNQPETGGAYQQPEKWFIQNYRTWIGTGKRLKAQATANAPRSTQHPNSSRPARAVNRGGINDF